jgi:hypothetical protein
MASKAGNGAAKIVSEPRRMLQASPLLIARPVHVTAVKRNRRDAHLGASILHLAAVDDVDQRHVLLVVNAAHRERLEDQTEQVADRSAPDVADRKRSGRIEARFGTRLTVSWRVVSEQFCSDLASALATHAQ